MRAEGFSQLVYPTKSSSRRVIVISVCLVTDIYLRGWNIPPFRFCVCWIILFLILFGSVMTHTLSCIGIIIDLKFIYHRVEYSTLLVLWAILVVYFYKV